jgi:hypothetical protein
MLVLQRNLTPGEVRTCKLTGQMIVYGDYYYQDTDDPNLYVLAREYNKLKRQIEEETFDYTLLEKAQNEKEYREYLKMAEQEYLNDNILSMEIAKNGQIENSILKEGDIK